MTSRRATRLATKAVSQSTRATKLNSRTPSPSPMTKIEKGNQDSTPSPRPSKIRKTDQTTPISQTTKSFKSEQSPSKLKDRKIKSHNSVGQDGPFPHFLHPTPSECDQAHRILASIHGARVRPKQVIASTTRAGCGDSPSVLDALVRTILSQNTSDTNSTRAKLSMDKTYGGSDNWSAIVEGGQSKLEESIRCGGLSQVKSKVILRILEQAKEKYGEYSLDHLHQASTEDAMSELLGFDGVGPKTASCVLLFCLQRDDFAVDTHVHRITGLLSWRPKNANREQTYQHLNRRIPDEHKYGLHILLVTHGKRCEECKAGGKNTGKCELRKAFREGKGKEEVLEGKQLKTEDLVKVEDVKPQEVIENIKVKEERG